MNEVPFRKVHWHAASQEQLRVLFSSIAQQNRVAIKLPRRSWTEELIYSVRKQYHFRRSSRGLLAWDVHRLIELSAVLPRKEVQLAEIKELDEEYWFEAGDQSPTCRTIVEHMRLIEETDLNYPIILSANGRVMDGMHRVAKALLQGHRTVIAVKFHFDPEPDYVGAHPDELPYGEA